MLEEKVSNLMAEVKIYQKDSNKNTKKFDD